MKSTPAGIDSTMATTGEAVKQAEAVKAFKHSGEVGEGGEGGASPQGRPRIAVIGTGGTFAMQARHRFDWIEYGDSGVVLPIDALIEQLGALDLAVEILPVPFRMLGSTAITPSDWVELAALIARTVRTDPLIDGIIVTHGTATLEETAWFLDLTLALEIPVVVTGAQRPANTDGSDASGNLRAALATAASPLARGLGVLVVMDGRIFAARDVTKAASFELAAFEAPLSGPLGRVDSANEVTIRRVPRRAPSLVPIDAEGLPALPRVDVVMSYAGADRVPIDAFVAAGARGLVSAGVPPGRPAKAEAAALAEAARRGVVVVQSSRAVRGTVPPQAFLAVDGILAGGDLPPHKLRILLMLALAHTADKALIQKWILAA
jgi:L-asparaginase